jgi:tetratricopeptide (TPR) repeat protein
MPLAAGLLVLAGLAAYHNCFSGPFIYDDAPAILDNPSIHHLWPLWGPFFPAHGEGLTVEGRPMLNWSLALNYAISGTQVWSYHALNLAIHLLAGLTLFGIVRRTVRAYRPEAALFIGWTAALLWIVHPLQTEAVTYVIQRAESLMGLFFLLTLYGFIRSAEAGAPAGQKRWAVLSVLACLGGMATKEVTATAPLLVLLYDRTFVAGSFGGAWRQRRKYYLALGATWVLLAALVASTGGNRSGSAGFGTGISWSAYALTQFPAIVTYLRLAVWPHPLVFEYGTFWVTAADAWPYAVAVLALLGGTLLLLFGPRSRQRWGPGGQAVGFAGAWFFTILAPTSLTPGTTQMIVEHRMYLPLAALTVLFALGVDALVRRGRPAAAAAVGLAVALGAATAERNRIYHTELSLWEDTAARRPENSRAHGNLADALISAGRTDDGLAQFAVALRLNPADAVANNNYGIALAALGRGDEAVGRFQTAVRSKPRYARAHFNLANALVRAGQFDPAIAAYRAAIALQPDFASAENNLGNALMHLGRIDEAIAHFQNAIQQEPDFPEADYDLANALAQAGRGAEAIPVFEQALRLRPDYAEAHINLGIALVRAQRLTEAVAQFRTGARLAPDSADARFNLANGLLLEGQAVEAIAEYRQALRLRPDYAAAHRNLERAERRLAEAGH